MWPRGLCCDRGRGTRRWSHARDCEGTDVLPPAFRVCRINLLIRADEGRQSGALPQCRRSLTDLRGLVSGKPRHAHCGAQFRGFGRLRALTRPIFGAQ
jgi:hypothetical protein